MRVAGIIFSNLNDNTLSRLTAERTVAAIPFGCRYTLVDFPLSEMVNAGIENISIVANYNYRSLAEHIGSGKDWDLARRSGGLKILTPYISSDTAYDGRYTRLGALKNIVSVIQHSKDDYFVLSDCDVICNIDLNKMVEAHIKNGADITVAVKRVNSAPEIDDADILLRSDETGRITEVLSGPMAVGAEDVDMNLNILVFSRQYLLDVISEAIFHDYKSLNRDIITRNVKRHNYFAYRYDGYFSCISNFADYFACNMDLIRNKESRDSLFGVKNRPILTKIRNSSPTYYAKDSRVKNSLIADGC
jgi:glucose-1-phosphate adenylyltransferase